MIIGMYHIRKDPRKVTRTYLYAAIAKMEGFTFYYFTAKDVDFENRVINGKYYHHGRWKRNEFPFPDVIMNIAYPVNEKQLEIYNKLKEEIPFTSYSVGNKEEVYRRLSKSDEFSQYIIPYKEIKEVNDVFEFIDQYQKVIIKPVKGKHGDNVIYIENMFYHFLVKEASGEKNLNHNELITYLNQLIATQPLLVQKYINSRRKTGEPYDIRLLLHKTGTGKWKVDIYPKIGVKDKIITNVCKGGQVTILSNFLQNEFGDKYLDVENYLQVFALQFAEHFESLYKHSFSELGVDIGLDENMKIWLYEVNWHPGQIFIESRSAKNAVLYAAYVAKKYKKEVNE
jgi:hypothetical protein